MNVYFINNFDNILNLFACFVFACVYWCLSHIVLCFCFVCIRLVYPMLPVSLDCPFLISPLVFSNVYWNKGFGLLRCLWFSIICELLLLAVCTYVIVSFYLKRDMIPFSTFWVSKYLLQTLFIQVKAKNLVQISFRGYYLFSNQRFWRYWLSYLCHFSLLNT